MCFTYSNASDSLRKSTIARPLAVKRHVSINNTGKPCNLILSLDHWYCLHSQTLAYHMHQHT